MFGPFGLGPGHGPIWPLTFLAKLALHNTGHTWPMLPSLFPFTTFARQLCNGVAL